MITLTFAIIAILNAIFLLGLIGVIYLNNKTDYQSIKLEKW